MSRRQRPRKPTRRATSQAAPDDRELESRRCRSRPSSTSSPAASLVILKAGDVIALSGPLGAGKTTLARALVTRLGGEGEVPSPTFALMQRYETPRLTLTHCDFYRLEPPELDELGLDDAVSEGAVLIEWPERASRWLPADRLDIAMDETATPDPAPHRADRTWQLGGEAERLGRDGEISRPARLTPRPPPAICKAMPRRAPMRGWC